MKNRRTQYEIFWEILQFCKTPKTITAIINHCNLNSKIIQNYLGFLSKKQYIVQIKEDEKIFYQTTEKSEEYLKLFSKLYLKLFEKDLVK